MLSKNDIALLRGMFLENNHILSKEFDEKLDIRFADFRHEIRDEIHAVVQGAVFASEERLGKKIDTLRDDLLEVINEDILPQIEEHTRQIGIINRHLKLA